MLAERTPLLHACWLCPGMGCSSLELHRLWGKESQNISIGKLHSSFYVFPRKIS